MSYTFFCPLRIIDDIMAKRLGKSKGKRTLCAPRGSDGRFLPNLPDPPGTLPPLALEVPPQPEGDGNGTPQPPGGLRFGDSSSSNQFYAERLRTDAGPSTEGVRAEIKLAPTSQSSRPVPERSTDSEVPIVRLPNAHRAPVTVETVTDEDVVARRRPRGETAIMVIGGPFRAVPSMSSRGHKSNAPRSSSPASYGHQNRTPVSREIVSAEDSAGANEVEELLKEAHGSQGHRSSRFSRTSGSVERVLRQHADRAEECTQAALDLNRRAMGLLMESLESAQEARTEAVRARERFEDLLSISSCHRERA
jgi:hypothetical protein